MRSSTDRLLATLLLGLFVVLKLSANFWLVEASYDLHRDEYLHLDQANHLDWGYLSLPPFTSWIAFFIKLLGNSPQLVRLAPALWGTLTLLVVWRTTLRLGGGVWACAIAASAFFCSAILRLNLLFQPNSFDILSWSLLYYCLIRYFQRPEPSYLWLAAVVVALGLLNKYNIVFLIIGLVPALVVSGTTRPIFSNRSLYGALLLGGCLILPNLWWQYTHRFPVVWHMQALSSTQLVNIQRLDFLKEQLLFFCGSLFVLLAAAWALYRHEPFRRFRFVGYSYLVIISLFVLLKAKGYYAAGLYPVWLAFGSVYLEVLWRGRWAWAGRLASLVIIWGLFVPFVDVAFPRHPPAYLAEHSQRFKRLGLLRWEDGQNHSLPQDFADMLGWRALTQLVEKAYLASPNQATTLVLCDNYGQAGAINYYASVKQLKAIAIHADYINWFDSNALYEHVVLVQSADDTDPQRTRERALFAQIKKVGVLQTPHAREHGTTVYGLYHAKVNIAALIRQDIADYKRRQGL